MARKHILEGQPGELKPGTYQFIRFAGPGMAIFRDPFGNNQPELFAARAGGHAGWSLHWRGTTWEFCRTLT